MVYKFLFVFLLMGVGVALVSSERDTPCPEPGEGRHGMQLHSKRLFGNCMRHAMMTLREGSDDCRDVMFGVRHCIRRDRERCMSGVASNGEMESDENMERRLNATVDDFIPVFCDGNFTDIPPFNRRNDSLPGCDRGYFAEIDKCSADFEEYFLADPLDAGLCERSRTLKECQRGKLRDHCSRDFVSDEYLEEAKELDDAGNFYCDTEELAAGDDSDSANSIKSSFVLAFSISMLFIVRAI